MLLPPPRSTLFPYTTLFRSRLATYPVLIPSLKERREDINLLVEYYIQFFGKQYDKTFNGFSDRVRSEEHTSELQSRFDLVCRLLLEKKKKYRKNCLNV